MSIDRGTWVDVLGCLKAVVAFGLLLWTPGWCLGWLTNLLGFRGRGRGEQIVWSVALSFVTMPVVVVMVAKYGSLGAVWWVVGMYGAGFVGLMGWEWWRGRTHVSEARRGAPGVVAGVAVVWVLFVIVELVDGGVGSHLYLSVTVFDHALRTAFVDAVMRTGVPPVNPLYWAGHGAPMRYYYFWYVLVAVAAKLAGATARQAMIASVVWAGFGLACVVELYCNCFLSSEKTTAGPSTSLRFAQDDNSVGMRRFFASRVGVALGLLMVAGLDVLPALGKAVARLPTDADMEWWSPDQVGSWMDSVLWVPHHVAGLVCCLVGFLLVWMAGAGKTKGVGAGQQGLCGVVAGVGFASAFGLSTWVAVAFAMVMVGWVVWVMVWERGSRGRVAVMVMAGVVAVGVLTPYLVELRGEASGTEGGGVRLLEFGVRKMIDPDVLLGLPGVAGVAQEHPTRETQAAEMVLLVPGYCLELGFFGVVLVVAWRRRRGLDEAGRTALALVVVGLGVSTFLRSAVVVNNDFGIRSILVVQFFLLMLGVSWWEGGLEVAPTFVNPTHRDGAAMNGARGVSAVRRVMVGMVWIGVAGTVYQVGLLRFYLPVEDQLGRTEVSGLAERAMAMRHGFAAMDAKVRPDAVVQFDPGQPGDYFRYAEIMMAGRQMANALPGCGAAFGGDPSRCVGVETEVSRVFAGMSAEEAREECRELGVSELMATRWDGVWADRVGWVWGLPGVVDTGEVRVVECGAR